MKGFEAIKERLYTIMASIETGDDFNFNWNTKRRLDTYIKTSTYVTGTVHYPEDSTLGRELKEMSTNEYRVMERIVEIKSKVKSVATEIKSKDIVDQNNEVIDGMTYDLHKAITFESLNNACLGVLDVEVTDASKESMTGKGVYFPFLLNTEFTIIYKEER
jgi:hypothetical protein